MMKFETVKTLKDEKFRRLTGIKRITFDKMVEILDRSIRTRKINSGRKKKLSTENSCSSLRLCVLLCFLCV